MYCQRHLIRGFAVACWLLALAVPCRAADSFPWQRYLDYPDSWFNSAEAKLIAANVLSHQSPLGDWPKNVDTGAKKYDGEPKSIHGSFENGATIGELRFVARMFRATRDERFRSAFELGMKHILGAQYETGGWPAFSPPPPKSYNRFISFNDGCMVGILQLLSDVKDAKFRFVRKDARDAARKAFNRGVECIVNCQILVEDDPTAWCARYDEETLEPRAGRKTEPAAISAPDSAGILMLLMGIDNADPTVVRAVHAGCMWFEMSLQAGIKIEKKNGDPVVIRDLEAIPIWARMYQLNKIRPIFTRRDGSIHFKLSSIEPERRTEVVWYGSWGDTVRQRYAIWRDQNPRP